MSIDRVSTNSQMHFLLTQIASANEKLSQAQNQVASGKVATDYAGLGDKTAVLESARAAVARADSYKSNTQLAVNQVDLQDTQISTLAGLADDLRQSLSNALATGDASNLMTKAQSIFDSASQILNSKDANGNYLYGGDRDNTPPFTPATLSDLQALPLISDGFANGTLKKKIMVGEGESVQIGVLASDIGTELMSLIKSIKNADVGLSFGTPLTDSQQTFLTNSLPVAQAASAAINNDAAANGYVYNRLEDATTRQGALSTLYEGFVSDLEDVDMSEAILRLNQNQVALQAALQVTAQLNQVSLLNYLK